MKKIIASFVLSLLLLPGFSQTAIDTSIKPELLQAPSSPAFNLLGISTSSIDRPTDLNSFRLSLQNATNNFTKLPSSYAVEIAPASIFKIKDQTLMKFDSKRFDNVFWQSLSLSMALTRTDKNDEEKDDSTSSTKLGLGIKFSIIRPHWSSATKEKVNKIYDYLDNSVKLRKKLFDSNAEIKIIEDSIIKIGNDPAISLNEKTRRIIELQNKKTEVQKQLLKDQKNFNDEDNTTLKQLASDLKFVRKGPFLDFATGMVLDFQGDRFNNSRVYKAGAWLTGGHEGGEGFSALFIARYLYQPDKIFADDSAKLKTDNISTFDAGGRLLIGGGEKRFTASLEGIYRSVINKNTIPSSWRLVFNASYDLGDEKMITLGLGRNFDGTITKDGNLIAALNFIIGFGRSKKVRNAEGTVAR